MKKNLLKIIYEDKYLIVVDKPNNILTISDGKTNNTLYSKVHDYLVSKNTKVFIIHRLDRDTSGLVMFSKNEKIKNIMQDNWNNVKREYYGIVNGVVKKEKGIIKSYLKETKSLLVYSNKNGKLAITEYEKIKSNNKYTLLKINIKTGRKHQIRVQLNDIGYPLVGDKKYGHIKGTRLFLHAYKLEFIHPITKENIVLETELPGYFNKVIDLKKTN